MFMKMLCFTIRDDSVFAECTMFYINWRPTDQPMAHAQWFLQRASHPTRSHPTRSRARARARAGGGWQAAGGGRWAASDWRRAAGGAPLPRRFLAIMLGHCSTRLRCRPFVSRNLKDVVVRGEAGLARTRRPCLRSGTQKFHGLARTRQNSLARPNKPLTQENTCLTSFRAPTR